MHESRTQLRKWTRIALALGLLGAGVLCWGGCAGRGAKMPAQVPTGVLDTTAVLEVAPTPAPLRAGVLTTWTLRLRDRKSGEVLTKFDIVHEKKLHLLITARDLSWFNHIHPELQPDGRWIVEFALPRPGTYRLYADYTRAGGQHEVLGLDVTTSEPEAAAMGAATLVPDVLDGQGFMSRSVQAIPESHPEAIGGDGYTVKLMPMPSYIIAKQPVMLHAMVLDAQAKPVEDLEPYLGAWRIASRCRKTARAFFTRIRWATAAWPPCRAWGTCPA